MDGNGIIRSAEVCPLGSEIMTVEKSGTDEKPYGGRIASALASAIYRESSGMGVSAARQAERSLEFVLSQLECGGVYCNKVAMHAIFPVDEGC